ncbi:hypothetical protein [Pseudonocardia oroxyli]|uniref:DNA segregation ATPase FtsK/SpoIIIE, S-DNA-T family n=1 Tax=Pseudonocardia oroxyli TaxID=366584 RepID=A0A1G8AM82_PSEOR|nr:hypothetical protein [Pseudonocardia oroxyli]SDH22142.1 DNA segregation ATPase FtsK/SpoIIIE, S-DNA-T family [Pseudonocardia oroxyli]
MGERRDRTRLTDAEADRLLDGGGRRHDLRRLLDAAGAPGSARELRGESAARSAFAAAVATPPPAARRPRLVAVRTVLATLAVAGTASGGVALAAQSSTPAPAAPTRTLTPGPGPGSAQPGAVAGNAADAAASEIAGSGAPVNGARAEPPHAVTGADIAAGVVGVVGGCGPAACGPPAGPQPDSPGAPGTATPAPAAGPPGQSRRAETPAGPKKEKSKGENKDQGAG